MSLSVHPCKYGVNCHQKNPKHKLKYSHPSHPEKAESLEPPVVKFRKIESPKSGDYETVTIHDAGQFIDEHFHLKLSPDFYDLFDFCQSVSSKEPLDVFVEDCGLQLIGPYHVWSHKQVKFPKDFIWSNYYRYYHDPPEIVNVIVTTADANVKRLKHPKGFHIGYFRDDPHNVPIMVASGSLESGTLECLGGNLFAALYPFVEKTSLGKKFREFAEKKGYTLSKITPEIKKRDKSMVCRTFHNLGLVVHVTKDDVGYRPIPSSKKEIVDMLEKIVNAPDENSRLRAYAPLDELITLVQFANDEGDYGEGLELGLDLLAFHPKKADLSSCNTLNGQIENLLSLGYELASRKEFADVINHHMQFRTLETPQKMIRNSD